MESNETKQQQRRGKATVFTLAGMGVFSFAMFVFAYIQNVETKKQQELSIYLSEELIRVKKIAEQNQEEAMVQRVMAEEKERMALRALEECKQNGKRK